MVAKVADVKPPLIASRARVPAATVVAAASAPLAAATLRPTTAAT